MGISWGRTAHRLLAGLWLAMLTSPAAVHADPPLPHVRSETPVIVAAIRQGVAQSTTFRRLVEIIDGSDVLVYAEQGRCGHGVRACLVMSMTISGPLRLLRIVIDARGRTVKEIAVSLGHELQHVVEVSRDPHVRTTGRLYSLFQRMGVQRGDRFETLEAIQIGSDVFVELDDYDRANR